MTHCNANYFPIQNLAKIACSTSSGVRAPVISSSSRAPRAVGSDEFLRRAAAAAAARARRSAARAWSSSVACRMFVIAGVSRSVRRPTGRRD